MSTLFNTAKYEKIESLLGKRASALSADYNMVKVERERLLAQVEMESEGALKEAQEKNRQAWEAEKKQALLWNAQYEKEEQDVQVAVALQVHFNSLASGKKELQTLQAVVEEVGNWRTKVSFLRQAQTLQEAYKQVEYVKDEGIRLLKEKEQIMNKLSTLYSDRCNNIISAELYKELSMESETKLKKINNIIEEEKIKKKNIKNKANILPDYTKKIKELLDLKKPKKELINTLIDKIVIDENRNINIIFKYDVIPELNFKYENRNLVRNPYGKKGKISSNY